MTAAAACATAPSAAAPARSSRNPGSTCPNCNKTNWAGMSTLMKAHHPDLVLLQLGVNDVWSGQAPIEPILANYSKLVEQARAENPNVVVVVAQIHKIITDNCKNTASTQNAEALVKAVPGWANGISNASSPVYVADLWTNSDPHDADDCVHPNDAGARRMGLNWFNALKAILK
ncbi:MAG: GDSL-type esterase/lipase family protein [Polyangiaceae bacterium]